MTDEDKVALVQIQHTQRQRKFEPCFPISFFPADNRHDTHTSMANN